MTDLYINNYIAYAFSIIAFYADNFTNSPCFKRHQIAIRQFRFHFLKLNFCINLISTIFSLTIKGYPGNCC